MSQKRAKDPDTEAILREVSARTGKDPEQVEAIWYLRPLVLVAAWLNSKSGSRRW